MGIIETKWTPTCKSVQNKNTKYDLASAIIRIWKLSCELEDGEQKKNLQEILMLVL